MQKVFRPFLPLQILCKRFWRLKFCIIVHILEEADKTQAYQNRTIKLRFDSRSEMKLEESTEPRSSHGGERDDGSPINGHPPKQLNSNDHDHQIGPGLSKRSERIDRTPVEWRKRNDGSPIIRRNNSSDHRIETVETKRKNQPYTG